MKYIGIIGIIFTLSITLLFSGCVSNTEDVNDNNTFTPGQPLTNDQINDLQNKVDEIKDSGLYDKALEAEKNPETDEKVTYCKIDMGEVIQEFWFTENEARMLTQGPGNFTDKTINETLHCTTNEKGEHACIPMEDYAKTVEGWKAVAQLAGTCNTLEYDMQIFKALTK
jgi:hypothetical protein